MCGRFTFAQTERTSCLSTSDGRDSRRSPRYNIAPTQTVLAVRLGEQGREGAMLRWGLVPSWVKTLKGPLNINARSETVAASPAFRSAFKRRRCLIPADGFYEWQGEPKNKRASISPQGR